jgi:predicted nucleic acid-binding protein
MDLVIDASAILAVLLNEPERGAIIAATKGSKLLAPESIPLEIGNAISSLLKLRAIGVAEGIAVYHGFVGIPIRFVQVDLPRAIAIAAEAGLYAYDAYLLSTAETYKAPLLTLDRRLAAAAHARALALMEV